MTILHVTMTPFNHETRLLKQAEAVISHNETATCHILALNDGDSAEKEVLQNRIFVHRLKLKSKGLPRLTLFQLVKIIEFTYLILRYARRHHIQIVTIHALVQLPIAFLVKLICGTKIIYDAHELETETTQLRGIRKQACKIIERVFIKFVDHVFVASPSIGQWYEDKYKLGDNVTVLMNIHKRHNALEKGQLHKSLNINPDKHIILYQGALINGRGIEQLISSFIEMNDDRFVLVFMGYGSFEPFIVEQANKYPNLFHHPAVEQSVLGNYTKSAFCGVCYVKNGSLNDDLCLPNKFFEYLFAGVPAIVSHSPDMKNILDKYKLGVVIDQLNSQELSTALDEIIKLKDKDFTTRIAQLNKAYNWNLQEQNIINLYKKLINL